MEAATLSTPQRKLNVVPVQKSLSLPSYARAGGEGIDHKLIFAALEQKERVRRKSKIFSREKTARQNIFCLPLPTSHKCKETSFSSDTSCSSLEYQKPKLAKKEDSGKNDKPLNTIENKPIVNNNLAQNVRPELKTSAKMDDQRKGYRSPMDTFRLNIGSSDSMERSSKSSTDSFSRKERLVAIKARVEAAREKYGDSSSEEECRSAMTRYSSDGSIHTSGRDYKSRSFRQERRLRRRSQDELALKKNMRKNDLNIILNAAGDEGIRLNLEKTSRLENEFNHFDVKTDFCPSPNFPDLGKKNYFSDFPSRENSSRFVQARIRHLENEERKRRSGSDFREKIRTPPRQSPPNLENASSASIEHRFQFEKQNGSNCSTLEKYPSFTDRTASSSPIPRSSQAPTPPPRSPKSKTFMNKTFFHHQNASFLNQESCSERIKGFQPKITAVSQDSAFAKSIVQAGITTKTTSSPTANTFAEKQNIRDLISNRRKTCGNFDYIDMNLLDDLIAMNSSAKTPNSLLNANKKFSSVSQIKRNDNKESFSGSESSCVPSDGDFRSKLWKSKWHENEQRREFMFNSLETKKKTNSTSWAKWGSSPLKSDACICLLFPKDKLDCPCKSEQNTDNTNHVNTDAVSKTEAIEPLNMRNASVLSCKSQSGRQDMTGSKAVSNERLVSPFVEVKRERHLLTQIFEDTLASKRNRKYDNIDKHSATANLESAMEELENVYKSLKISSDNLLDQKNITNVSVGGDGVTGSKSTNRDSVEPTGLEFKSALYEGTFSSEVPKTNNNPDNNRMYPLNSEPTITSNKSDSSISGTSNEVFALNQLSIDELFNGLTQQLDLMEQKLLTKPKVHESQLNHFSSNTQLDEDELDADKLYISQSLDGLTQQLDWEQKVMKESTRQRTQQTKSNNNGIYPAKKLSISESLKNLTEQIDLAEALGKESGELNSQQTNTKSHVKDLPFENQVRLKSPSPQVSVKREFFDNLCKNRSSKYDISIIKEKGSPEASSSFNKKKYKAVRSLSQNISYLMTSDINFSMDNKTVIKNSETDTCIARSAADQETCSQDSERLAAHSVQDIKQSNIFPKSDDVQSPKSEEIRHIRVSMDTNILPDLFPDPSKYPRLSSAVSSQSAVKPQDQLQEPSKEEQKSVLDESGLEKLLNSLLGEVPENQESSLLSSPSAPASVPTGNFEDVNCKRTVSLRKMDVYTASKAESKAPSAEPQPKHGSTEESSPKVNNFRQNNNALTNHASFIPVYTKKADVLHNFKTDDRNVFKSINNSPETSRFLKGLHSPPLRQKFHLDKNEISPGKTWVMHTRRRSVGFEDMTSLSSRYDYNLSNSQRNSESLNCNAEEKSDVLPRSLENPENGNRLLKNLHGNESESISRTNQNSRLAQNENTQSMGIEKSSQFLKDKSAKRKSSLNRMDFLDFSTSSINVPNPNRMAQQKDSSSDEESDSKLKNPKSGFLSCTSKRKHVAMPSQLPLKAVIRKTKEALPTNSTSIEIRSNPQLPKTLQKSHLRRGQHRRLHSIASNLQKFSHSAGELESLTDLSETACASNKICLSAQEFDTPDSSPNISKNTKEPFKSIEYHCSVLQNPDVASHASNLDEKHKSDSASNIPEGTKTSEGNPIECVALVDCMLSVTELHKTQKISPSSELNGDLDVKHIDSEDDFEVACSTIKMEKLDLSGEGDFGSEKEDGEFDDNEQRPSSILRKTLFEDKRELHSILKQPPPDEKYSKTPPSILKHRESSEEKESWFTNDLISILKKSASEDESCNSGSDTIRPILKVSTDEDSPGGSVRPRPILKKRTSFSEECSYASYPNNELKPILKKKSLTLEELPKPILKSRRKSEDTKSTLSEFISSRPRAYSADMGIKQSHETRFESLESNKQDTVKPEHDDL